jgi:diguanylate cyclase (GGDEF)-like protein
MAPTLQVAVSVPLLVATPVGWIILGMLEQLERARAEAARLASTDLLTGVLNRRRFIELSERELERAQRANTAVSIILLDIDDFKQVNDRHGHHAGDDEVLKAVAQACSTALRPSDHFGRWGGEEFVVLLPRAGTSDAVAIALRLRGALALSNTATPALAGLRISASIGVASTDIGIFDVDELIRRADRAMYDVKQHGKDNVLTATSPPAA